MKRQLILTLVFTFMLVISSAAQTADTTQQKVEIVNPVEKYYFNVDSLLHHIKTLSSDAFEGRRTGTRGAHMAKDYIIKQFHALGVQPLSRTFKQPFSFKSKGKKYEAVNVLGFIPGTNQSDDFIVITAHYDHEGIKDDKIYNGADDDASGISALFAFAEYFKENPPKHNVILAAFDGEELGLKGAYHFVENSIIPKGDIKLNLNMDMISRSEKGELFAVGTRHYKQFIPIIDDFKDLGKVNLLRGHDGDGEGDDWTHSSDHAPFHEAKIPFIYFGVEDHEDYHKPTDDFENIDPQFYQDAVQTIIEAFNKFDARQL